jgi:hypothetical protein
MSAINDALAFLVERNREPRVATTGVGFVFTGSGMPPQTGPGRPMESAIMVELARVHACDKGNVQSIERQLRVVREEAKRSLAILEMYRDSPYQEVEDA